MTEQVDLIRQGWEDAFQKFDGLVVTNLADEDKPPRSEPDYVEGWNMFVAGWRVGYNMLADQVAGIFITHPQFMPPGWSVGKKEDQEES